MRPWGWDKRNGFGSNGGVTSITDLFTGFQPGGTYTGGPTVVADNLGVLQASPANVLAVQGARYSAGWLPTAANGSVLWTSRSIRTRKGSVAKYDSTFLGFLNEPARTNKVTCRKHNPVDTTNITFAGDVAAVPSVVDSVAALAAAKLDGICTNGKVYRLNNSAGTGVAAALPTGATGNTNAHSLSVYIRKVSGVGTSLVKMEGAAGGSETIFASSTFTQIVRNNEIPSNASRRLQITAGIGDVIEFILPQLEEGAFCTSIIPGDTLATVTRAATVYSRPTAGVLRANDFGVWGRVVPSAAGQNNFPLIATIVDGANNSYVNSSNTATSYFKKIANTDYSVAAAIVPVANVAYEYQLFQSSSYGMGVRVKPDGGSWTSWTLKNDANGKLDAQIGSTYTIGSRFAVVFAGGFPFTIPIMHPDPKAELERLAVRYP